MEMTGTREIEKQLAACQAERDAVANDSQKRTVEASKLISELVSERNAAQAACGTGYVPVSELEPTQRLLRCVLEIAPDLLDNQDGHFSKMVTAELARLEKLKGVVLRTSKARAKLEALKGGAR